jgi:DNA-binding FadR family transcriptional regulator
MDRYPRRGTHGQTVHDLGRRIVQGDFAPGQVIDMEQLEREFDASRPAIREALRVLAAKGLLDARPRRGTFVRPRGDWSLLDPDLLRWQVELKPDAVFLASLDEVRQIVEPAGSRLAALRRTPEHLERMEAALTVMAADAESNEHTIEADLDFHRTLLNAAGNELLDRMEIVIEAGLRVRDQLVHAGHGWSEAAVAHEAVLAAVRNRDEQTAEDAMRSLLALSARDASTLGRGENPDRPLG